MAASNVVENMIVRLLLDPSRLLLGAKQTESKLATMANSLARLGTKFSLAFTLPIVAGTAKTAKAFADFDDAMTRSMAIAEDASDAMRQRMEENAFAISRLGRTSSIDLAKSYHTLIAAGQSAEQSLRSLATIEKFAVAGMIDMETATSQLVDSMFALGINSPDAVRNAKNMGELANMLSYAAALTNASEEQLAKTIRTRAGAASRAFGVSKEELFGVMSVYAQQGIKGEFAGEQIYIFLRDMQAAALKNASAFKLMGVRVYDTRGELRALPMIVRDLEQALGGMSDRSKKATLSFLGFTDRSIAATYNLLGTSRIMWDFTKKFQQTSPDVLADKYARMMESFAAQMQNLRNNIEMFAIEVGRTLAPMVNVVAEKVKMMSEWFGRMNAVQKKTIVGFLGFAALTGPVLLITAALIQAAVVTSTFTVGVIAFGVLLGKTTLIAGALTGVVVGLTRALRGPDGLAKAFEFAKGWAGAFISAVAGFFENIKHNFKVLYEEGYIAFGRLAHAFQTLMVSAGVIVVKTMSNMFVEMVDYMGNIIIKKFLVDLPRELSSVATIMYGASAGIALRGFANFQEAKMSGTTNPKLFTDRMEKVFGTGAKEFDAVLNVFIQNFKNLRFDTTLFNPLAIKGKDAQKEGVTSHAIRRAEQQLQRAQAAYEKNAGIGPMRDKEGKPMQMWDEAQGKMVDIPNRPRANMGELTTRLQANVFNAQKKLEAAKAQEEFRRGPSAATRKAQSKLSQLQEFAVGGRPFEQKFKMGGSGGGPGGTATRFSPQDVLAKTKLEMERARTAMVAMSDQPFGPATEAARKRLNSAEQRYFALAPRVGAAAPRPNFPDPRLFKNTKVGIDPAVASNMTGPALAQAQRRLAEAQKRDQIRIQKIDDPKADKRTRDISGVLKMIEKNTKKTSETSFTTVGAGTMLNMASPRSPVPPLAQAMVGAMMNLAQQIMMWNQIQHTGRGMGVIGRIP